MSGSPEKKKRAAAETVDLVESQPAIAAPTGSAAGSPNKRVKPSHAAVAVVDPNATTIVIGDDDNDDDAPPPAPAAARSPQKPNAAAAKPHASPAPKPKPNSAAAAKTRGGASAGKAKAAGSGKKSGAASGSSGSAKRGGRGGGRGGAKSSQQSKIVVGSTLLSFSQANPASAAAAAAAPAPAAAKSAAAGSGRRRSGGSGVRVASDDSKVVECPLCGMKLLNLMINSHMDNGCSDAAALDKRAKKRLSYGAAVAAAPPPPPPVAAVAIAAAIPPASVASARLLVDVDADDDAVSEVENAKSADATAVNEPPPAPAAAAVAHPPPVSSAAAPAAAAAVASPNRNLDAKHSATAMAAPDSKTAAAPTAPIAAPAVVPHSFFTSGPKPGAAFEKRRKPKGASLPVRQSFEWQLMYEPIAPATAASGDATSAIPRFSVYETRFQLKPVLKNPPPFVLTAGQYHFGAYINIIEDRPVTAAHALSAAAASNGADDAEPPTVKECTQLLACAPAAAMLHAAGLTVASVAGNGDAAAPASSAAAGSSDGASLAPYLVLSRASPFPTINWESSALAVNSAPAGRRFTFPASLLKSLMQKNVRLCRPESAVRCGLALIMRSDFTDFLRRVIIIIIEDAILHPLFPLLTWMLVAAFKGLPPLPEHIQIALSVLYQVAAVTAKDHVPASGEQRELTLFDSAQFAPLSSVEESYVRALLIRSCLGGQKGDMSMLRRSALVWCRRFTAAKHADTPFVVPSVPTDAWANAKPSGWAEYIAAVYEPYREAANAFARLETIGVLTDEDIILSAVDYHCSPVIDLLLHAGSSTHAILTAELEALFGPDAVSNPERLTELVVKLIWTYRSSLTTKLAVSMDAVTPADDEAAAMQELFHRISADIDQISHSFVLKRCTG